jgi:hypothetical protein
LLWRRLEHKFVPRPLLITIALTGDPPTDSAPSYTHRHTIEQEIEVASF